jgi:hypothetical protein
VTKNKTVERKEMEWYGHVTQAEDSQPKIIYVDFTI